MPTNDGRQEDYRECCFMRQGLCYCFVGGVRCAMYLRCIKCLELMMSDDESNESLTNREGADRHRALIADNTSARS